MHRLQRGDFGQAGGSQRQPLFAQTEQQHGATGVFRVRLHRRSLVLLHQRIAVEQTRGRSGIHLAIAAMDMPLQQWALLVPAHANAVPAVVNVRVILGEQLHRGFTVHRSDSRPARAARA
ncbi:hypothetical protein D9M68_922680 [compost metagenome]